MDFSIDLVVSDIIISECFYSYLAYFYSYTNIKILVFILKKKFHFRCFNAIMTLQLPIKSKRYSTILNWPKLYKLIKDEFISIKNFYFICLLSTLI